MKRNLSIPISKYARSIQFRFYQCQIIAMIKTSFFAKKFIFIMIRKDFVTKKNSIVVNVLLINNLLLFYCV